MGQAGARLGCACPPLQPILGPGFDAAAVALDFYLEIEAEAGGRSSRSRPRAAMRSAARGSKTT